jgi:PadR family transcriptional regulator, regulatory protein PadR
MSTKEQRERIELRQGTLDLLILRTLLLGPAHGHAVAKAIEFRSDDVLQVEQGSLYPALHRLIKRGWIAVQEGTSENNRRAKVYHAECLSEDTQVGEKAASGDAAPMYNAAAVGAHTAKTSDLLSEPKGGRARTGVGGRISRLTGDEAAHPSYHFVTL